MSSDRRDDSPAGAPRAAAPTEAGQPGGRVAVTGANGFIARRFLELYAARFEQVVALVRSFPVAPVRGVEYRIGDVGLPHTLRFGARDCDRLVHCAYDHRNRQTAVAAADNVVAACRDAGIERLVHLSTVAVYDQTVDGTLDEGTRAARWRDPYIESKLRIERRLAAHWRAGYRNTVILQPTIVYGPGGSWSEHAFRACRAERVELPHGGDGRCNAVYVDDVCQAVFLALTSRLDDEGPAPPRYLVNGPDDVSWEEFFAAHCGAIAAAGLRVGDGGTGGEIVAPPTDRLFADDAKADLAMRMAFRPLAARLLYAALGLRPSKSAASVAHDPLAVLRDEAGGGVQRFRGMGRLYTATRCRVDGARAARELGYAPQFDLQRGTKQIAAALRPLAPRLETPPAPGVLVDLEHEAPPATLHRRVCIIGSGLGGGALAASLLQRGDDVVAIEAGNGGRHATNEDNVDLEISGLDFGLAIYRDISLGGSGNAWRGLCAPHDAIDFEAREWIPRAGWPIGAAELEEPGRAAAALLGIDDYGFFTDQSTIDGAAERARDIGFDREQFGLKYFLQTRPPRSFRNDLLDACRRPGGPLLLQNAPALELITDAAGRRVEKVLIKDGDGHPHEVTADLFVVCAGALETPRLLLNSRPGRSGGFGSEHRSDGDGSEHGGDGPGNGHGGRGPGLGNEHDLVGRYLMDHPMVAMGQVRLRRPRTAPLFQALRLAPHRMIKAGLVMRDEAQRRHRLPNHSVFLLPSLRRGFDDRYERARRSLITARRKRLSLADLFTVATNPNVIQWALSYVSPLPALFRYADLFFIAEQTPTASSRVDLSAQRDRYGYRMARAHWEISDDDIDSMVRFNDLLLEAFPAGDYETTFRREREDIGPAITSAAHFCGTARMGTAPQHSVVDADLKVWGLDNLYVCDASVFPTSGNANPGLTITTLAVRLARRLAQR